MELLLLLFFILIISFISNASLHFTCLKNIWNSFSLFGKKKQFIHQRIFLLGMYNRTSLKGFQNICLLSG